MKFDVVIGNPPYNKDLYIDFVLRGHKLLKIEGKLIMITPAKWQAKGGQRNEEFRNEIVPHMRNIVYYPDCADVFSIGECGGICYYDVSRHEIFINKHIRCVCEHNEKMCSESYGEFPASLSIYGNSILKKVTLLKENKWPKQELKTFNYMITTPPAIGGTKGAESFLVGKTGMLQVVKSGKTYSYVDAKNLQSCYGCLCSGYTEDELELKRKYMNTKLIRFLILLGLCTQSVLTAETMRFVPDIDGLSRVTDTELYAKYGLTPDEIDTIESIVKERNN